MKHNYTNLDDLKVDFPEVPLGKATDLSTQKFNRIQPLFRVYKKNDTMWAYKCDCGIYSVAKANHIVSGAIRSCGCFFKENTKTVDKKWKPNHRDLTGNKYGYLEPLEFIGKDSAGKALWRCKCECGKETIVSADHLLTGHTRSCGCKRASQYEDFVDKWLTNHGIKFEREVKIKEIGKLRFDFKVYKDTSFFFIEIQGQQHFEAIKGWGGEKGLARRQENDRKKKEWCNKNNISLIELFYYDNLEERLSEILN